MHRLDIGVGGLDCIIQLWERSFKGCQSKPTQDKLLPAAISERHVQDIAGC